MDQSAKSVRVDLAIVPLTGAMVVGSARRVIFRLTGEVIVPLIGTTVDFGVHTCTEMFVIVVFASLIALEVVVLVSEADITIALLIGVVLDIGNEVFTGVASVDANTRAAAKTTLECIPMSVSSEEALLFGWDTSSCWPAAA